MSTSTKFECTPYKPFEPDYHPQRPIIVGEEGLDSPDTVTLKYEEAVARANGDLRGGSPPEGLLPMSQYGKAQPTPIHGYDAAREYDGGYQQYGASEPYTGQQPGHPGQLNVSQMNQDAFAANSAVGQYMVGAPPVVTCQPTTGVARTKVLVKASSPDDMLAMSPAPYIYLVFGAHRVLAEDYKNSRDAGGCCLTFTAEAPDMMVTNCPGPNVPLTLLLEGPNGEEISRSGAGQFVYHDEALTSAGGPEGITGKASKSPEQHHPSPRSASTQQLGYDATNSYDFNAAPQQQQGPASFNGFSQDGNMLSSYRSASFSDHYPRAAAPPLRTSMPAWGYNRASGPAITPSGTRPSLTPLPMPAPTTPTLIRTASSIQTSPGGSQPSQYPGSWGPSTYASNKASLTLMGKLDSMAEDWTPEEWANKRRLVLFTRNRTGTSVTASFRPVNPAERPPHAIIVSCIWWAEKGEAYVTSVDTISLLEKLVVAPEKFSVEEKNRIRRNLEGYRPTTVSKAKPDSEEFFKVIMGFPNPKPRNIEKDVKVFPWKTLETALKKIIGKYSASTASTVPTSQMLTHQVTPSSAYPTLPTPPAPPSVVTDPVNAYGVGQSHLSHHDNLTSPRTMPSGGGWSNYQHGPPVRTLSPALTSGSPRQGSLRIGGPLPAVSTYDARPMAATSYGGAGLHHSPLSQQHPPHPPPAAPGRWDPSGMPSLQAPASYAEPYQPMPTHHVPSHSHVYGSGGYGDGSQRP